MTINEAANLRTAPVIHFESIGSTNDEALARARQGDAGPTWLLADRQIQGRGRQGRPWTSPVGNLYTTLLVPVAADGSRMPQMAHVAAVALSRAIQDVISGTASLYIKWPNDLLVDRAKVAGILVEATTTVDRRQICVVGWGVNCRFHPDNLAYPTTDLSSVAGREIHPAELFAALVPAMADALVLWNEGVGFDAIRARWLAHALPTNTPLTVRTSREQTTGRFHDMDQAGRLILLGPNGLMTVEAGDVFLGDRSAAAVG